jgi:SAM-dependent methyltransferase
MTLQEQFQRPEILACPGCKTALLDWSGDGPATCGGCETSYPLHQGWPLLLSQDLLEKASAEWDGVATSYATYAPTSGFPLIDGPLIESCSGDVLEVGCGDGRLMRLVNDRCRTLVGIDPAPAMTAKARSAGFKALTAAAEDLPFCDASFDQVISGWASMRYTDQARSFPEVARVLRPGGTFTFTLWNFHIMHTTWKLGFWRRGRKAPPGGLDHFRGRDVSDITQLIKNLAAIGLAVQAIRSTLYPSRIARALYPFFRYYRGRLGALLGYNVILSCTKPAF